MFSICCYPADAKKNYAISSHVTELSPPLLPYQLKCCYPNYKELSNCRCRLPNSLETQSASACTSAWNRAGPQTGLVGTTDGLFQFVDVTTGVSSLPASYIFCAKPPTSTPGPASRSLPLLGRLLGRSKGSWRALSVSGLESRAPGPTQGNR